MVDSLYGSCSMSLFWLLMWLLEFWKVFTLYIWSTGAMAYLLSNTSRLILSTFVHDSITSTLKTPELHPRSTLLYRRTWRRLCRQQTDFVESVGRQPASVHSFHFLSRIILHLTSCPLNSAFFCATYFISLINVFSIPFTLTPLTNQVSSWKHYTYWAGEGIIPPPSHLLLPRGPSPFVTSA